MTYDSNQSHPKIEYKGTYPNLHVTQGADGSQTIRSLEPGSESYFEVQPSGSYTGHGPDGQHVQVTVDKKHEYNGDGKSSTTDGHHDEKVGGTHRQNVDGSTHKEVSGNQFSGGGGAVISGSQDSHIHSVTSGDHFTTTEGNVITDHTGHVNHNITGDFVEQVTGNRFEMVTGDYGINNQGGNYDIQTDSGKTRVFSGSDILIESGTKITLKVGSSTITITDSNITVKSTRIDLNP
jgi:hypothetical protein